MKRIAVVAILLLCALAVMAEDVTFMSNRRHWEKLPTATLMKMGNDFMNIKNLPDSGMLCYSIVANRYNEHLKDEELKQCIRATCGVGTIHQIYYNNLPESYMQILKAKDLAEKHSYDEFYPHILMELGNLYWRQCGLQRDNELYKEALISYKTAFWKAIESNQLNLLPFIMINLNNVAFTKDVLNQTAKERATFERLNIPDSARLKAIAHLINQGMELVEQGRYEQAIETFKNTSFENHDTNIHNSSTIYLILSACVYNLQLKIGRKDDAWNTLMQAQELLKREQPGLIGDYYHALSEFYQMQNNFELADKYELLWWRTTDSIAQASQANNVSHVVFLHELDKMNEEQKALVIKQKHDRQMLWMVSGFLVLALLFITLLVIIHQRIKQKNRVLYENNLALLAADEQRRRQAEEKKQNETTKYGVYRMDEQSTEEVWQSITHVMEYSQEIFDENFTVARLAAALGLKPIYVSQAINQHEEWTFPSLLAHYRIREACRRMNDTDRYGNYTVQGIGQSIGYRNRSHFVKLFKQLTGLTPSDYMKQCRSSDPIEAEGTVG